MPNGGYYVRNKEDLSNAIEAIGRAGGPNGTEQDRTAARRHVMKRARALKLENMIPDTWNPDGSLKHSVAVEDFFAHHGIKGMHWGVRRARPSDGSGNSGGSSGSKRGSGNSKLGSDSKTAPANKHAIAQLEKKRSAAEEQMVLRAQRVKNLQSHIDDAKLHGMNSELLLETHGIAQAASPTLHRLVTGKTHQQTVAEHLAVLETQLRQEKHALLAQTVKEGLYARKLKKLNHEDVADAVLEHFGVKGMHWGVRRGDSASGTGPNSHAAKKVARADRRFAAQTTSPKTFFKVYNGGVKEANRRLDAINAKPKYKNQDFTRDSPTRKAYYKEVQTAFLDSMESSAQRLGTNASGTKRYGIIELPDGSWDVTLKPVQHADSKVACVKPRMDSKGYIVGFDVQPPSDYVQQSSLGHTDLAEGVLEHHGVKGMHWGVRRDRGASGPISADAARVSGLNKTVTTHGTRALSNEELQAVVTRLNLEQQHARLTYEPGSLERGHSFVKQVLGVTKTGVDAVNTGRQVYKIVNDVSAPVGRANRRHQRNKPLKVVSIS